MRRVFLVTGGAGFIGSEAVKILPDEIHLVSRSGAAPPGTTGHMLDIVREDPSPLLREIRPTHLLHMGWHVPAGGFWHAPENLDWVAASLRLARGFAEAGGQRMVGAGTCAEYDWSGARMDEVETPLKPHTLYGEAKASLFRLLQASAPNLGISFAWGRIFNPYGPAEKPNKLFSSLVDTLVGDAPFPTTEGAQLRPFMHVSDLGKAFVELLLSDVQGPVNMVSGDLHSVRDFVTAAASSMGKVALVEFGAKPLHPGEPPVMDASSSRLLREVGFSPRFGFEDGIADAVRNRLERFE